MHHLPHQTHPRCCCDQQVHDGCTAKNAYGRGGSSNKSISHIWCSFDCKADAEAGEVEYALERKDQNCLTKGLKRVLRCSRLIGCHPSRWVHMGRMSTATELWHLVCVCICVCRCYVMFCAGSFALLHTALGVEGIAKAMQAYLLSALVYRPTYECHLTRLFS